METKETEAVAVVPETGEVVQIANLAMSLQEAKAAHELIRQYCKDILKDGTDFGKIPGTGEKKVLLKNGAENLCRFLRLRPQFVAQTRIEDFKEGVFFYRYECNLVHINSERVVGSGIGSCNSMEKKYRWRYLQRKCPVCGAEAIKKSKWADKNPEKGWYCYKKINGCGENFHIQDPLIINQKTGKVLNEDIFDQANTIDKMAQKRSLVAATLICAGVSDQFTQDLEDFDADASRPPAEPEPGGETPPPANGNGPPRTTPATEILELQSKIQARIKELSKLTKKEPDKIFRELLGDGKNVQMAKVDHIPSMTTDANMKRIKSALQNADDWLTEIHSARGAE